MTYTINKANAKDILWHFNECEVDFLESLKSKVDIAEYVEKIYSKATSYEAWNYYDNGGGANGWISCSIHK